MPQLSNVKSNDLEKLEEEFEDLIETMEVLCDLYMVNTKILLPIYSFRQRMFDLHWSYRKSEGTRELEEARNNVGNILKTFSALIGDSTND